MQPSAAPDALVASVSPILLPDDQRAAVGVEGDLGFGVFTPQARRRCWSVMTLEVSPGSMRRFRRAIAPIEPDGEGSTQSARRNGPGGKRGLSATQVCPGS